MIYAMKAAWHDLYHIQYFFHEVDRRASYSHKLSGWPYSDFKSMRLREKKRDRGSATCSAFAPATFNFTQSDLLVAKSWFRHHSNDGGVYALSGLILRT